MALTRSNGIFYPPHDREPKGSADHQIAHPSKIKRWDGAARACARWDYIRRDPELWFKNGNCLVHLYSRGQSRRGPAFKVPLAPLLAAGCQPLLSKYMYQQIPQILVPTPKHADADFLWAPANLIGKVDLYIAPPLAADVEQAFRCRLAVRNFFAWVYRRSMVGEYLGSALVGLMDSMTEFRGRDVDVVQDILSYIDEEGYLNMTNQPVHALAILRLAEHFRLRDLYVDAFAHCTGMGERLYPHPEYQTLGLVTRRQIHAARAEVDSKLRDARLALSNFLYDDLTGATLGLSIPYLEHLQKFRNFLTAFYTTELGNYPPALIGSMSDVWSQEIYMRMRVDFEELYSYLADSTVIADEDEQPLPQPNVNVLKHIVAFDRRHGYTALAHRLPLLPDVPAPARRRRNLLSFMKGDKLRPDSRLVAHAALVKASNGDGNSDGPENVLVTAYRQFEEALCSPHPSSRRKSSRVEAVSQADSRWLRWILIYGVVQVLRDCTEPPPEVRDFAGATYSLVVPARHLPPQSDGTQARHHSSSEPRPKSLVVRSAPPQPPPVSRAVSSPVVISKSASALIAEDVGAELDRPPPLVHLTDPRSVAKQPSPQPSPQPPAENPPALRLTARGTNILRRISQVGSVRHSIAWFKSHGSRVSSQASKSRTPIYHEIVVDGYGNGTNSTPPRDTTPDDLPDEATRPVLNATNSGGNSPSSSFAASDSSPSTFHSASSTIERNEGPSSTISTPNTDYASTSFASPRALNGGGSPSYGREANKAIKNNKKKRSSIDTRLHNRPTSIQKTPEPSPPPSPPASPPSYSSSVYSNDSNEGGRAAAPPSISSSLGKGSNLELELEKEVRRRLDHGPPTIPPRSPARSSLVMAAIPEAGTAGLQPSPLRIRRRPAM